MHKQPPFNPNSPCSRPCGRRRPRALSGAVAIALLAALAPREAKAVTFFTEITSVSFPSPQPCLNAETLTGEGCYTSWLVLSDIDSDGDLDILFANGGGYYTPGNAESSVVYLNDGKAAFRDATPSTFQGATSRLRQVSVGDIEGDGDLDIFQPGGYGLDADKLWVQTTQGVFQNQAATRLPAGQTSRAGSSHFGDLDGDGDLDLIVGDWANASSSSLSRLVLYTNDGTGKFKRAAVQVEGSLATEEDIFPGALVPQNAASGQAPLYFGRRPIDLDFADIDGDFDLDILINHRDGQSRIFFNDGRARFTDGTNWAVTTNPDSTFTVTANYPPKKGPYAYNQELCDIDGDGDLDLLVDNAGGRGTASATNISQISMNDGTGKFIDETATRIFGEPPSDDNAVKCVDVNNDGNLDLVVASLQADSEKLLLNDGSGAFNFVPDAFPVGKDPTLGIDIADLNGDGIFDVVTGQGEADPKRNRIFRGSGASLRDTRPPIFRDIQAPSPVPGEPIVFLMAVADSVTSDTGEHVKDVSVAYASTAASGSVKAKFVGGDLFRAVVPAVPNGTQITLTPRATDRAGNPATAPSMVFMVGTVGGGEGGAGGGGSEPEGGGTGGLPSSGGTAGTTAGTAGTPETAGTGGTTAGAGGSPAVGGEPGMESGGEPGEPVEGNGGTSGKPVEGSAGEPAMGTGGSVEMPAPNPTAGGPASGATGGTDSAAGAAGDPESPRGGDDDDGGCTVSPGPSRGGLSAAILLALVGLVGRRRAANKRR